MNVTYFHRRRLPNSHFSIEQIFERLRLDLADDITAQVVTCPHYSRGLIPRLRNLLHAWRHQGGINHVTGDSNYLAIGLNRKRTILTHHDASFMKRTAGLRRMLLGLFWLRLPIWRATLITTVSEASKQDLLNYTGCNPNKIHVIPNAISNDFRPVPKAQLNHTPIILQVGTAPNKNIERLAAALKGIPCSLRIIGALKESQQMALEQNNIQFTTMRDLTQEELIKQYVDCDVVAFASTIEGFGMPILEAQATGRIVITSNCSSMPETAGDGAIFVDPQSIPSIRAGILSAIAHDHNRNEVIEAGFRNAERFNHDQIARQYLALYASLESQH